jgi:hypothetical protein
LAGAGWVAANDRDLGKRMRAALGVDVLVAKGTDAAWLDRRIRVWKERLLYAPGYVRMFRCGVGMAARSGG